jgi:hypothetical protein
MKWKYKVITLSNDAQANTKELDTLGSVGWELVAVQGDETVRFAYLKQKAEEPRHKIKL